MADASSGQPERRADVQSVRRALALLKLFSRATPDLSVGEAARALGVHPSSASRLLATLADAGFARPDPATGRYRPGFAALELADVALHGLDVRAEAISAMRALSTDVGESVNLAILDGTEAVIVEQAAVASSVRFVSWIGRRVPVHANAHGKVHLAFVAPDRREAILAAISGPDGRLARYTERTHATRADLEADVAQVRRRGYGLTFGELDRELAGICAPIFDHSGAIAASLSVSGPAYRLPVERLHARAPQLMATARLISTRLGWSPTRPDDAGAIWSTTDVPPLARSSGRPR